MPPADPNPEPPKLDDYHKWEMQTVIERINSFENMRFQMASFFVTFNITGVGITLTTRILVPLFLSILFFLILIIMDFRVRRTLIFYYYRGLMLQKRFAPGDNETFLKILPNSMVRRVRRISEEVDMGQRYRRLRRLAYLPPSTLGFWSPLVGLIFELALGLVLWRVVGWPVF